MKTSSILGGGGGGSWTQVTSPNVLDLGMMTIPGKCSLHVSTIKNHFLKPFH